MTALAAIRDRVEETLVDISNNVWDTDAVDEGIRKALDRYSESLPLEMETLITVLSDGREIALNGVDGLIGIIEVWWPYDSDSDEEWPPNVVSYQLWWDDAQPVLFLADRSGNQPKQDDEIRLWYTKRHTIQNLDSASVTTIPDRHIGLIVTGSAGYAIRSKGIDYSDQAYIDDDLDYKKWSNDMLKEFGLALFQAKNSSMGGSMPQKGWGQNG